MQAHKTISERESKHSSDPKGRLFYLALPPSVYPEVTQGIKENCTDVDVGDGGFLRVIVEKPFGKVTQAQLLQSCFQADMHMQSGRQSYNTYFCAYLYMCKTLQQFCCRT